MSIGVQTELKQVLGRLAAQLFEIFCRNLVESWSEEAMAVMPKAPRAAPAPAPASTKVRRKNRPQNSAEEVEQIEHELVALLNEKPGEFQTAKVLLGRLAVDEKPFRQALKTLLDKKQISLQGARRSARYGVA